LPPLREASNSVSGGSGLTLQSGWHVTPPSIFLKLPFIAQSTLLPATEGWRQHFITLYRDFAGASPGHTRHGFDVPAPAFYYFQDRLPLRAVNSNS
jgi:hypothetical protein